MMEHNLGHRRTKIVVTIGPASWDEATLRALIRAGMDVARINFSHGDHSQHGQTIAAIRRIAQEEKRVVAILCDLQGPKIRIGGLKEPLTLAEGDTVTLTLDEADGTNNVINLPHPEFLQDIAAGERLLLDDGNLEFSVESATPRVLTCKVVLGGVLGAHKGIMAPDTNLSLPAITSKDRQDIQFALAQKADYLALSFVRSADDILELRQIIKDQGGDVAIVAKIEKHEALEHIQAIIDVCDGVMVARGDLGLEIRVEEVPFYQKRIVKLCNDAAKPVIIATQMLNSMVDSPRPTRAEASDVYNAIIDGTDAIMLSNETATGHFPVESVHTMATIAALAEQDVLCERVHGRRTLGEIETTVDHETIADAISESVFHISGVLKVRAIITLTLTGYTARRVARERPHTPIICVTPNEITYRRMALVWGVSPLIVPGVATIDEMIEVITQTIRKEGLVEKGDTVVIVMGVPFYVGGMTNMLKIHKI